MRVRQANRAIRLNRGIPPQQGLKHGILAACIAIKNGILRGIPPEQGLKPSLFRCGHRIVRNSQRYSTRTRIETECDLEGLPRTISFSEVFHQNKD